MSSVLNVGNIGNYMYIYTYIYAYISIHAVCLILMDAKQIKITDCYHGESSADNDLW